MDYSEYEYVKSEAFKCSDILTNYGCKQCDFETDLRTILITHTHHGCQKTNFNVKSYICNNCNFTSYSILVFSIHQRKCDILHNTSLLRFCEYKCNTPKSINAHYSNQHSDEIYKSNQCSIITTNECYLKNQHFECQHCSYKTVRKGDLRKHIIFRHTKPEDIKWFECTHCNYKAKIKNKLKHHITVMHTDKTTRQVYECIQCPLKSFNKTSLKKHMRNHFEPKRFQCTYCPFKSNEKVSLKYHIGSRHANHDEIEWFYCDQCDYKALLKTLVRSHFKKIHCEMQEMYQCNHCSFKTWHQEKLRNHIQRHNMEKIEKGRPYECSECFFRTDRMAEFRDHCIVKHTDEAEIQWLECNQCDYKAKIKRTLQRHVRLKHLSSI